MAQSLRDQLLRAFDQSNAFFSRAQLQDKSPLSLVEADLLSDDLNILMDSLAACKKNLDIYRSWMRTPTSLPHDILIRIFECCLSFMTHTKTPFVTPRCVLAFSQVCRHWRSVALNSPGLWVTPIFDWPRPEVTYVMVERAQNVPLYVKAKLESPVTCDIVSDIVEKRRLRSLNVLGNCSNLSTLLMSCLNPALDLEELQVSVDNFHRLKRRMNIPDAFLSGYAPKLRKVRLVNCVLATPSPLYCAITKLQLHLTGASDKLELAELLSVLMCAPALECVQIFSAIKPSTASSTSASHGQVITLSNLILIHLWDDLGAITRLLNHIVYPSTTELKVETGTKDYTPLPSQLETFLTYLSSCPHLVKGPPIKTMQISSGYEEDRIVDIFIARLPVENYCVVLKFRLFHREEDWPEAQQRIIKLICNYFPLQDIEELEWGHEEKHMIEQEDAERMLKKMPKLRRLFVNSGTGCQLIAAIQRLSTSMAPPHLHALSELSIFGTNILLIQDTELEDKMSMIESLALLLNTRHASGHGLEVVKLNGCYINRPSVDRTHLSFAEVINRELRGRSTHIELHDCYDWA